MADQPKIFPAPVDWEELYPGRFLKAVDLKGKKVTLTIAGVKLEELIGDKGPQVKGIVSFEKTEKHWALNKTNGILLKEMLGKKVQAWIGHRVTLYPTVWNDDDCIRVWGSPEVLEERVVSISLPRKRPFNMTLHHVQLGGAPAGDALARAAANAPPLEGTADTSTTTGSLP